MKTSRFKTGTALLIIIAGFLALLYFVRPPGVPAPIPPIEDAYVSNFINEGSLPGVTWVDDVHPIFTRNECVNCHIRGFEAIAEGFEDFALGIIDPKDKNNAFWSYHELVYAEGPPQIQEGEVYRDGQCCWPAGRPPEQRRRIWPGHPERSAMARKLERDYYYWNEPPRFFEEGIGLSWGLPMPMYKKKDESEQPRKIYFEIRPFYERILLHGSLWLGGGKDELHSWPPRIPAKDRAVLRYWISNAMQLMEDGTGIAIEVVDSSGTPVKGVVVRLVGNYNSRDVRAVADEIAIETAEDGIATLFFPKYSVVTSIWYISARHNGKQTGFTPIIVKEGKVTKKRVIVPPDNRNNGNSVLHQKFT